MRRVAFVLTAAALAATAAPATAITKTVRVPYLDCEVTVETNDVAIGANNRGLHVYRYGETKVSSGC